MSSRSRLLAELLLIWAAAGLGRAQPAPAVPISAPAPSAPATPAPGAHPLTAEDVEVFLDGFMPLELAREDIAGAAVSIVKDGNVLFAKGYGYAGVAKKTPVSPDNTLFRPGSISKLFTWTSILQLVEQGKLDLDKDVNTYLDFRVPAAFGKPLTLRNIMTHTSGFEEVLKDLFVPDAKHLAPLDAWVKEHLPAQIFPPGSTPAYSNYATAMAGYIVQRVSGKPFELYVEDNIFGPLHMTHCSFRQPLPAALEPLMSSGYVRASEGSKPYEFIPAYPAGSSAVSALDMTKFMLAHLGDGEYQGVRILKTETARMMHSRQFGLNPAMNGMALGFYEESRNGHRIIGHGGDTIYFHSDLHLVPDAGLGFFVSYNSAGRGEISPRGALWNAFLDRYLPYTAPTPPALSSAPSDARTVAGQYMSSRREDTNLLAITAPLGEVTFDANSDGTISSADMKGLNGAPKKFREVGTLLFQEVDGQDKLAFQKDASGRLNGFADFPAFEFQRATGLRSKKVVTTAAHVGLGIITLTVLLWPISALVRRHYGRTLEAGGFALALRTGTRLACVADLLCLGVLAYIAITAGSNPAKLGGLDLYFRLMQFFGLLGGVGALVAVLNALACLVRRSWWGSKLAELAIAAACLVFTGLLYYWHMLKWSLLY